MLADGESIAADSGWLYADVIALNTGIGTAFPPTSDGISCRDATVTIY